jgi:hypothetical protein
MPDLTELLKGAWTVADLKAALAKEPDDAVVIVYGEHGQDGESPACDITRMWYRPESTWGGQVYFVNDKAHEHDPATEVRAIFIEPVN